jgi:siroheme synthase-like protein
MQFPVNLNLHGRPVLVVGGGRIALRKVEQLLMADAEVTVLSPLFVDEFHALPVTLVQREYVSSDVDAFRLVITATGNMPVNQQIFDECEAKGIWINSADDPDRCSFTLPAAFRRGALMVTVSTGGASPALASWLRSRLEEAIGPEFTDVVARLAIERSAVHAAGQSTEDINWRPIIEGVLQELNINTPLLLLDEVTQ